MRVVVVGCGGIGGTVVSRLVRSAHASRVAIVTGNAGIAAAARDHGVRWRWRNHRAQNRVDEVVVSASDLGDSYDVAFMAVPPNRMHEAVRAVAPTLAPEGHVVTLANGLPEEVAAAVVGSDRVVGGVVSFGASVRAPADVEQTSAGTITFGRLGADADDGVRAIAALFDAPRHVTHNLRGARWTKLAINCAVSSLGTIGGDRLGALLQKRFARRLALDVITEVVEVARAQNVALERVAGVDLEWLALSARERAATGSAGLFAKHSIMLGVGTKYRKLRSSMLAAIERGREPPIDFLNGEVVRRAQGVDTHVNAAVVDVIKGIARGEVKPSVETLRALYERTRA